MPACVFYKESLLDGGDSVHNGEKALGELEMYQKKNGQSKRAVIALFIITRI